MRGCPAWQNILLNKMIDTKVKGAGEAIFDQKNLNKRKYRLLPQVLI